jgi:hypothetical protein
MKKLILWCLPVLCLEFGGHPPSHYPYGNHPLVGGVVKALTEGFQRMQCEECSNFLLRLRLLLWVLTSLWRLGGLRARWFYSQGMQYCLNEEYSAQMMHGCLD